MITYRCDGCGHAVRVNDDLAGRRFRCPKCAQIGTIPSALLPPAESLAFSGVSVENGVIKFHCACGKKIGVALASSGVFVRCPKCGQTIRAPSVSLPQAPPEDEST